MDILFFSLMGHSLGLAALTYLGSIWGMKSPTNPDPLKGIKASLFFKIWAIAAGGAITQRIVQEIPQENPDIWAVVITLACIAIGRNLCRRMIDKKDGAIALPR